MDGAGASASGRAALRGYLVKHILVVDDMPALRHLVADVLQDEGYAVEEAADGADALACARRAPPDAIGLDLMMPALDGGAFLRERRADPELAAVPVLVLSASRDAGLQEASALGAAFLAKPFSLGALVAVVGRLTAPA